ncbi:MAG TPA: response regulator [candidate division Zixibacteria bacterium]|nr:response regulator [candidate division Zixibacteria bacterium]
MTKKSILIVDNKPRESAYLQKQLEIAGFDTFVARTGEGAIQALQEKTPHLVLLDAGLSDMDGLEVVSFIRNDPKTYRIPVVAMSALPHVKDRSIEAGCDDFLSKPVRALDVITRLRRLTRT